MKKLLCSFSIIVPIILINWLLLDGTGLVIQEIGVYLPRNVLNFFFISASVLWLCCSPWRRDCCNGHWPEVLFYLIPFETICLFLFSQWHFVVAVLIAAACGLLHIALIFFLDTQIAWDMPPAYRERQHKVNSVIFRRMSVLICAILTTVPCFSILFIYGFQSPVYRAHEEAPPIDASTYSGGMEDLPVYDLYINTILCFDEESWQQYSMSQKVELLQSLADMEAAKLGILSIPISIQMLGAFTLGEYDTESNEIRVDIEHVTTSTAEECINTICHEMCHAWQDYLVDHINWEMDIFDNPYFDEIRRWKDNQAAYIQPGSDFSAYETQPVEASARTYAEEETDFILQYIIT